MEQGLVLIITGLISLIMLIIFLGMASNIAKIKRHFIKTEKDNREIEIELLLFKGKKTEALDIYYDLAFERLKSTSSYRDNARRLDYLKSKIIDLGGDVPEEMITYITKHK